MGRIDEANIENDRSSSQTVNDLLHELVDTTQNLASKTELNYNQVLAIYKARLWSTRYFSDYAKTAIKFLKEDLISLNRKGRGELVQALQGAIQKEIEMNRPRVEL